MLECLHELGYIYIYGNNFSLTNIMLNSRHDRVSLFSFERCIPYKDVLSGTHRPRERLSCFSGDARFASVNKMRMLTSSRRDDMINLIQMLIYFR